MQPGCFPPQTEDFYVVLHRKDNKSFQHYANSWNTWLLLCFLPVLTAPRAVSDHQPVLNLVPISLVLFPCSILCPLLSGPECILLVASHLAEQAQLHLPKHPAPLLQEGYPAEWDPLHRVPALIVKQLDALLKAF